MALNRETLLDLEELVDRFATRDGLVRWFDFRSLHSTWQLNDATARKGLERFRTRLGAAGVHVSEVFRVDNVSWISIQLDTAKRLLPRRGGVSQPASKKTERHGSAQIVTSTRIVVGTIRVQRLSAEEPE